MNNTDQPANPDESLTQPVQHPVNNQRGNFPIILGVLILLLLIGGGAYYLGTQNSNRQTTQVNTPSPTAPIPTTSTNKKSNWKTYSGTAYTFIYPSEWKQTGPDQYLETVQLLNPAKTVSITISKGQYPYGFSGEMDAKTNKITINVNEGNIEATETILNNKGAYVDFAVGEYHILYGTDYPAVGTPSLTDYNASKETIAEILSSFKLTK